MDDHDLLLRLEGKVDALTTTLGTFIAGAGKRDDDHETRLRLLEGANNRFLGKQSLIGGAIGVVAAAVAALISSGKL
jgi:hypothetical protein